MKSLRTFVVSMVGVVVSATALGANPGSCEAEAAKLTPTTFELTTEVTLTKAYNSEAGTYDATNFVYYYKVNLKRGKEYSFWLTGPDERQANPMLIDFYDIYPREADPDKDEFEPGAMFQEFSGKWKPGSMQVLVEDEWYIDEEDPEMSDPPSWDYYVQISGTNATSATLHYQQGNALPLGIKDNPQTIEPVTKEERTSTVTFVDGEFTYAFQVSPFLANHRYLFATDGGTGTNPYSLGFGVTGKLTPYAPWASDYNSAWAFDPDMTGEGTAVVAETLADPTAQVTLHYQLLPTRQLKDHNPETLPLGAEGVRFVPGRINATGNQYYDAIIDQKLFKTVQLTKGRRYVVETNGSKTNLLMRIYGTTYDPEFEALSESQQANKTGSPKYTGKPKGDGSYDLRYGFTADYTGVYYVGVCQDLADDDLDEPLADNEIQLTIEEVVTKAGDPDAYDNADDTYVGATILTPVRGIKWALPAELDETGSDWHRLGKCDWYDVYKLPVRAGLGYGVSVTFESETETSFTADVFLMNGKSESRVKANGDINPGSDSGLFFAAEKNGIYFIRIRTAGTYGLDCPRYKVHTIAYHDAELTSDHVGLLHVDAKGCPEATWTLGSESMKYPLGTTIALPIATNRAVTMATVKFGAVKNFVVAPSSVTVSLLARDEPVEAFAVYSDKYDPKDDGEKGAYSWSLSNKEKTESRTLWTDDDADYFALTGKDGYYYDIVMNQSEGGDAVFSILHDGETLCAGVTNLRQFVLPTAKTKYYLKVQHKVPASPKDTSYSLSGFYANVGAIKFAKAEYKVKDNAAEVKLTVNRTAKDGKVRVKLWTEHGTNSAGTVIAEGVNRGEKVPDDGNQDDLYKFYHNQQTLEWANGDNKAKTVIIKLIPDKYPTFHDFVRFFKVRMKDAFDGSADCYHASFAIDSKTKKPLSETQVTFQESAKKTPGTVQVDDKAQDVKKPVFNVRAGGTLDLNLVRVGGDDGDITVKIDTSALTGGKGTFEEVTWADGDVDSKTVSIAVPPATDAKTSKKVTLKLSATSKDKPKFAASSITVNVSNDKFAATLADYAKALSKTCGYTIKEGKSGTWIVNDNGDFVSTNTPSALTFTITGPALFSCKLDGVETNVAVTVVGKTQTFVVPAGVKKVSNVKYLFNGGAYETVYQAVQYGYDEPISTETAAKLKVSVGKLPDGIKLEQDKASKAWYVRGVPTKAGYFFAEIQDAQKNVLGTNAFEVVTLRSAIGTFNGLAEGASTNNFQSFAQVTLTTATSGKLSAKVAIGGKTYSFAATGFSRVEVDEESSVTNFIAELTQLQKVTVKDGSKSQSLTYTNMLTVTIGDRDEADMAGWRSSQIVDLNMAALPDLKGSGFQKNVYYAGRAYRDNSKQAAWVTEAAQYAGYYTIALVPQEPLAWEPQGNGYLTLTLDAKGKVKIAGALPNGTAYSASSVVGNLCTVEGDCAVSIPLYSFKNPTFFGGWLTLRFKEAYKIGSAVTVLDDSNRLYWISQDAAATYDGTGFYLALEPIGGYYDTVANLQRYYLSNRFEIKFPVDDDLYLLQEILKNNYGEGYDFVAKANPNGMAVDVVGDTVSVAKQVLVKEMDGTKKTSFNDWSLCTNAANVKVTFKRATGIITGTCDLWYEGIGAKGRVQNKLSGLKHAGVLLMSWDADTLPDSFDEDTWTAGAVVIPQSWKDGNVTRKWNASFPFNIKVERFED